MLTTRVAQAFDLEPGYLDTPSYGRPSRASAQALHRAVDDWASGSLCPTDLEPAVARIRASYGRIVGAAASDVTLSGSVSQMVGMVAASLPAGATVLVAQGDFTSVIWPFATDSRLTVRAVPLEALVDEVRPGVDLVAVSGAQSRDGRVADLDALASAARDAGARTLIDMSQAAPWLPIDASRFDVVVAGGYKWLTTPRGLAFAAVRPGADWLRPVCASWYGADVPWDHLYGDAPALSASARRLDTSPPWQLLEAAAVALELHASYDPRAAHRHCVGLADELRAALGMAPAGSAIVSVAADAAGLQASGVRAAQRGGRVRVGFHVYNDERDLALAVDALRPALVSAA